MAIFHLTGDFVSRKNGQSIIAKAAYNAREELTEERTGEIKDYTRASGLQFSGIYTPANAPDWAHDRAKLWNAADRAEKRKDARLAQTYEVALPHELTNEQRRFLVQDFVRESFTRKGYAVDVAIHAPDREGDERNYHAHILVSDRRLEADGFAADKKERQIIKAQLQAELEDLREKWEHIANRHLERYGHEARIDRRSLEDQGINREPTQHLGPYATQLERDGEESELGNINRDIEARNQAREEAQREYEAAQAEREQWEEKIAQAAIQKAEEEQKREAVLLEQYKQRAELMAKQAREKAELEKQQAEEEQKKPAIQEITPAPERWERETASDRVGEGLDYIGNQAEGIIEGIAEGFASLLGGGSAAPPQKTATPEKAAPERRERETASDRAGEGLDYIGNQAEGIIEGIAEGFASLLGGGSAAPPQKTATPEKAAPERRERETASDKAGEGLDYIGNQAEGIIEGIAEGFASLLGGGSAAPPQKTATPEKEREGGKFRVIDKETGVASGLSNGLDSILDGSGKPVEARAEGLANMLGGASPGPRIHRRERSPTPDQIRAAEIAITNINQSIKRGDDIDAADLRNLPKKTLEDIREGGDEYLMKMCQNWEIQEREREKEKERER